MSEAHHQAPSIDEQLQQLLPPPPPPPPPPPDIRIRAGMSVDDVNRALVILTLKHTAGRRRQAAKMLGISMKTLYNWTQRFGIEGS